MSSRDLDNDFPHGAAADHFLVRLEDVVEGVHRVGAVLDLAYRSSQRPVRGTENYKVGLNERTLGDELENRLRLLL